MNLQKYYQNHIQIGCDKQIKFLPKEVVELEGKRSIFFGVWLEGSKEGISCN